MNNKIVYCKRLKYFYDFEVQGFDEERSNEREFLLNLIKFISFRKNIFASFFMGTINTINKEAIMFSLEDFGKKFSGKLQIDINKLCITEKLFENRNTSFYIFEKSVEWDEFVNMKKLHSYKSFKESSLLAIINIYDFDGIVIMIKKGYNIEIEYILSQFISQGYGINILKKDGKFII